jgi:cytoskeletal protein RodZ
VVLSRGANPAGAEIQMTVDSVPGIGRALQLARTQAGLSLPDAAIRVGLASSELEALESGTVGRMQDRIETLRALRTYADSLGLPGDSYVLTVLNLWPSFEAGSRNGDTGVVPVVSVSSAPAGGHSPSGDYGSAFPMNSTGAHDSTITGVVGSVGPLSINDTRPVPIFETGQVPAVRQGPPRYLKVLVGVVALLVVLAGIGLGLHNQISGWVHSARHETSALISQAKQESGVSTGTTTPTASGKKAAVASPKVTVSTNADQTGGTLRVAAAAILVKVVTNQDPSWVQVTDSGSQAPVFSQVIPGGGSQSFPVTASTTIETGSLAAHFLVYANDKPLTYYVPSKAPFTMTFTVSG